MIKMQKENDVILMKIRESQLEHIWKLYHITAKNENVAVEQRALHKALLTIAKTEYHDEFLNFMKVLKEEKAKFIAYDTNKSDRKNSKADFIGKYIEAVDAKNDMVNTEEIKPHAKIEPKSVLK